MSNDDKSNLISDETPDLTSVNNQSTGNAAEAVAKPEPKKVDAKQQLHEKLFNPKKNDLKQKQRSDAEQMNNFLGPMLANLEEVMATNMKELDKLEEELLGNDYKKQLHNPHSHVPEAIRGRKSIDSIMKKLEDMILNDGETGKEIDPSQKKSQEFLQDKFNKTSEVVKEKLEKRAKIEESQTKAKASENLFGEVMTGSDAAAKTEEAVAKKEQAHFENITSGDVKNMTCLAHSLSAYLITANSQKNGIKLRHLTVKIYDSVNLWLSRLFRFQNSSVIFHDQEPEGFIRMCNIVLNLKFTKLKELGYHAFAKRQPSIYISAASKYSLPEYKELIAAQLSLPTTCIKTIVTSKVNDTTLDKIDIPLLTYQLETDIRDGYLPIAVVANAGTANTGQCDDLKSLNALTTTHRIWLHLEGCYLATLALNTVPTEIQPIMSGDSITIDFGTLIGVPSLSHVTIYKNRKDTDAYLQPFNNIKSTLNKSLPYWCVLQSIGHEGVLERIRKVTDMAYYINDVLKKHQKYIQILKFKLHDETTSKRYSLSELLVSALSYLTFVDYTNPVVIFKCDKSYIRERISFFAAGNVDVPEPPPKVLSQKEKLWKEFEPSVQPREQFIRMMNKPEESLQIDDRLKKKSEVVKSEEEMKVEAEISEYTDTLSIWLCDLMNSLNKNIELEVFEIDDEGVCIRYSPIEHANVCGTTEYDVHMFDKSLDDIITILDASIKCKATFIREVRKFSNLIPVNILKWAGIGAIRYIPEYLLDKVDEIAKYSEYLKTQEEKENKSKEEADEETNTPKVESNEVGNNTDSTPKEVNVENTKESTVARIPEPDLYDVGTKWDLDKCIKEINDINEELVKKLQAEDGAFSIGIATDNMKAVKFGMVNESDAVEKLAFQVQEIGKNIEESSRYLEKMTELVREGIETANRDLRRENEDKLNQQGVIRKIPLVSGIFNWISPLEPQTASGRTLNLQSGKIETTEVMYKNRLQQQADSELIDANKAEKSSKDLISLEEESTTSLRGSRKPSATSVNLINLEETVSNNRTTVESEPVLSEQAPVSSD